MEKQLPKNWMEVQLIDILEVLENGSRPKGGVQGILEGVPSLGGEHLNNNGGFKFGNLKYVPTSFAEKMNRGRIKQNDILIVKDGATTGKTSFIDNHFPFDLAFVNEHVFICRTYPNLNSKSIFYFLFSKIGFDRIMENFTGSAQGGINQKFASNTLIALPPLPEQNRIVTKLDALFAQLETIKSSMANVPLLLKDFRQQVLTQAVTGKLTEEWRKEKKIKNWNFKKLEKVTLKVGSGSTPTGGQAAYLDEGIPLIRSMNVHFNGIKYDGLAYLNESQAKGLKNVEVFENDVLLNITGASIGRVCLAPKDLSGARVNQHVCIIRVNNELKPSFLNIYLSSPIIQNLINNENYGVTRQSFTKAQILELEIPIPLIDEQEIILNKVESLFAKADAIEKQYESLKAKIDNLPQALLHKAFKGELTEQLDSDGDAKELLKEIEALKAVSGKVKKDGKVVKEYEEKEEVLGMVAEPKEELQAKVVKLKPTNTEIYKRTLLAAEIVYQLKDTNTLGHLKLQKMLYLCQEIGSMNLPMNFLKQAMGPYDNQLARSLDKQFVLKKWFEYQNGALLKYKPLENCGKHKDDFVKFFENEIEQINYLINKFTKFTSNQIEAVATLYACWKEAIEQKELITDKLIITKFYQWSKEKEKFREENLIKALGWMRRNGVEPK